MAPPFLLVVVTAMWGFTLVYGGLFRIREEFGLSVALEGVLLTGIIMFAWIWEVLENDLK